MSFKLNNASTVSLKGARLGSVNLIIPDTPAMSKRVKKKRDADKAKQRQLRQQSKENKRQCTFIDPITNRRCITVLSTSHKGDKCYTHEPLANKHYPRLRGKAEGDIQIEAHLK